MTTAQRYLLGITIMALLALLSWLTILPGYPAIYGPFNFLIVVPLWGTYDMLRGHGLFLALAAIPLFFGLWCWPLLRRGCATLPTRSMALLVVAIILSALWIIFGIPYGLEYQGIHYVVGIALINVICWTLLIILALRVHRRPSFGRNLTFHAALFAWLAWYAFPYLGEVL
jgi:hypothetical protein